MNNIQINKVLYTDNTTSKIFRGTYPIDKLPTRVNYPSCFVINNQPSYKNGEHWVAVYFTKDKKGIFFDSFGKSPTFYKLDKFLRKNSNDLVYNNKQIQTLFSEYCGYYCLLFLLFISKNNNLTNFVKLFKKPYYNDKMIKNYLEKY